MSIKSPLSRQFGSRFDEVFDVVKSNPVYDKVSRIPTLDLNFAKSKSLYDGRSTKNLIDFVRNTESNSSTYVDAAGLIKRSVTNLLVYSEEFDQDAGSTTEWGHGPDITVTANDREAPNGTLTADKIVQSGTGAYLFQGRTVGDIASTSFTISLYVYAESEFDFTLRVRGNGSTQEAENFTVSTAVNQWKRVSATKTFTSSADGTTAVISLYADLQGQSNNRTVWFWGAQLEKASTVGEYVKTTATKSGAPRFDHNPTTGESLGLFVEESRTNLLKYSEQFDNANWTQAFLNEQITANEAVAPNGLTVADKVSSDSGVSGEFGVGQAISVTANTTHTISIFAKAADSNFLYLRSYGGTSNVFYTIIVDLSSGTVTKTATGSSTTNVSNKVTAYPNGWYRISITAAHNHTFYYLIAGPAPSSTADIGGTFGQVSYLGAANQSIYLWGAQLEAGDFPTSYIPTEGAAVTRGADVTSISGTNFSGFYSGSEHTIFSDSTVQDTQITQFVWALRGGTYITSMRQPQTGVNKFRSQVGDTFSTAPGIGNISDKKAILAFSDASASFQVGSTLDTFAPANVSDPTFLAIGNYSTVGSNFLNGTISRLTYWNARVANEKLKSVTS